MEGLGIEKISTDKTDRRMDRTLLFIGTFIVGLLIGLFIGIIISPIVSDMLDEDTPIYHEYVTYREDDHMVFENEELDVKVLREGYDGGYRYSAEWITKEHRLDRTIQYYEPSTLYQKILEYEENLTTNQLRWYRYMLEDVLI